MGESKNFEVSFTVNVSVVLRLPPPPPLRSRVRHVRSIHVRGRGSARAVVLSRCGVGLPGTCIAEKGGHALV